MSTPHFLTTALRAREGFGLRIARSGSWLATEAQLAGTSQTRRAGLMGRTSMPDGHALVIAPTQGVHTFGMRFDLDIVCVSRSGRVVSLRQFVRRRRLVFSLRAFAMVELAAGAVARSGIEAGDVLEVAIPAPGKTVFLSSTEQTSSVDQAAEL